MRAVKILGNFANGDCYDVHKIVQSVRQQPPLAGSADNLAVCSQMSIVPLLNKFVGVCAIILYIPRICFEI